LIDKYGLSQALWVIGAFVSNICVASCLFREPKITSPSNNAQAKSEDSIPDKTDENHKNVAMHLTLIFAC
jgi:hypothetical protein